jgi:hypothetical protein
MGFTREIRNLAMQAILRNGTVSSNERLPVYEELVSEGRIMRLRNVEVPHPPYLYQFRYVLPPEY